MPDNQNQLRSRAFRLAALDSEFLLGDSMRGVRFLLEYAKAEEHLRNWGIASTVVVFGSARVMPGGADDPQAATAPLPQDHDELGSDRPKLMNVIDSNKVEHDVDRKPQRTFRHHAPRAELRPGARSAWWYEEARRFGRIVSERGGALAPVDGVRHNVIATGGGPGIMEAAARGASEAGAPAIGFNIRLPREQEPNAFTTPDLTFQFHYFSMRKMHLAMRARALVVFPGGFGTMDELFELLTLVQTGKAPAIPILCFDRAYWTRIVNFEALVAEGMISPEDLDLFCFADDAETAWSQLCARGLKVPA